MKKTVLISFICLLLVSVAIAQNNLSLPGACGSSQPHDSHYSVGNGNDALGQTYNNTACGLNYVTSSARITTRYSNTVNPPLGPGTGFPCALPAISGIPTCYAVDKAYIYYDESYMTGASTTPTLTLTNPSGATTNYSPTLIGTDGPKCWTGLGEVGTYAFRADVTASITGIGNGVYTINNIVGSSGEDTQWEIDGATLIIIYKDPSAVYQGSLILDDGEYTLGSGGTINYTMTGYTACGTGSNSTAFMIFADLQDNTAVNFSPTLNGTSGTFLKLFWNYCEVNTTVNSGQSSSSYSYTDIGDCYSVCLAGLYFQTTTCATCSSPALTLTTSSTPASCSVCNGTATVSVTGGTAPYTYTWSTSPVQNTSTASNLCAGPYTVTVTDATGCNTSTASVTVTSSAASTVSVSPTTSTICSGNSVTLTASGVVSYSWSPAAGLTATTGATVIATPATTTTYIVTGTDATGCTSSSSALITVNPGPTVSISASANPICLGASTTLTANGATTYLWSGGLGTVSPVTVTPASTTTYIVTGTTAGCTGTANITITVDAIPNAQISPFTNSTCGLNNGSATATGGPAYLWSTGQTTATITGLAPNTYTVTVTVAAGCSSTASVTINNIPGGTVTATSTNENCGHANGTASSTPVGGTPPYTYLWSNGHTTQNITNLPAGTYTVTVTDASSCTAVTSVTLTNIAGPSLQVLGSVNETCSYGNGSATVNAINGVLPYSYLWSNGNTSATATNLHAGTYTCTVTDSNHCTAINTVTITNTPGPTITISGINSANCGMSNGSATLNISGGTPAYTPIIWSNGETSQNILNVPTGTYCVTVTDANSCTTSACVTIPQKPGPVATHSYTDEICQMKNGTATAVPSGGVPPYIFSWSNGAITQTATGLSQGNYTYTVTDQGGCSTSGTVSVGEIPGPTAYNMYTPKILSILEGPVYFWDESTGGTPPYTYQWDFGDASSGTGTYNVHPYPNLGTYIITEIVTDSNGCKDTMSDTVKVVDIFTFYTPNAFTPNNDGLNDTWAPQGTNIDTNNYNEYIYDRWGNLVFQTTKWQVSKTEPPKGQAEGWNGTIYNNGNNKDIVMDIYVYKIDLREFNHGPKHEYVGRITLVP
jgi:gliding motility-associated-like protein